MTVCEHTHSHACTFSHPWSWSLSEETNPWARLVERQDLVSLCTPLPFVYPSGLDGGSGSSHPDGQVAKKEGAELALASPAWWTAGGCGPVSATNPTPAPWLSPGPR